MWIPLPMKYVSERDDYKQPAKESEAWSWLWTQRILLRREPSQREISKALCWSRHKVRQLQKDLDQFADQYFKKTRTKVVPIGHGYMGDVEQTPTNGQPENNQKTTTSVPETDHPPAETPSETATQQPLYSKSKSKNTLNSNSKLIDSLKGKVGKGVNKSHLTEEVIEVYNFWHDYKKTSRMILKKQVRVIRAALKSDNPYTAELYTVEDCKLIIDFVFNDEWWLEHCTDLHSILNDNNLNKLTTKARDKKNKPQRMSALPPQTISPKEKEQQQQPAIPGMNYTTYD